jgi:hypothetical protein
MTSTLTHVVAVVAGFAIFATWGSSFTPHIGLVRKLVIAVAFGLAAALLITAVRTFG